MFTNCVSVYNTHFLCTALMCVGKRGLYTVKDGITVYELVLASYSIK